MNEQKCTTQEASHYINDLFDTLEIKGNNQLLFNQFCSILGKYSKETIKKSWAQIFNLCDLPNGQLAGRLPKMHLIETILTANRMDDFNKNHYINKKTETPSGLIKKLWDWGLQLRDGEITREQLDNKIKEYDNEQKYKST